MGKTSRNIEYPSDYDESADIPKAMKILADTTTSAIDDVAEECSNENKSLKDRIKVNEDDITNIKAEQVTHSTEIENLQTSVQKNTEKITEHTTTIGSLAQDIEENRESIETNTSNIEKLQAQADSAEKEIKDLESNVLELQEENENLNNVVKGLPMTEEQTGEILTFNNSSVGYLYHGENNEQGILIKGNTKQKQFTGKNLFNYDGLIVNKGASVDVSKLETGVKVTYTGEEESTSSYYRILVLKDLSNYVGKTVRVKTNFISSSNNLGECIIGLCDSDGNNRSSQDHTIVSGTTMSFTVPEFSTQETYLYMNLYANYRGTVNKGDYVDYTDLIVTIDDEDMTYEPYVGGQASPNPNFPQKIYNCGDINFEICNNNMLKIANKEILAGGRRYKLDEQKRLCINDEDNVASCSIRLSDLHAEKYSQASYDNKLIFKTNCSLYLTINKCSGDETLESFYIAIYIKNFNTEETRIVTLNKKITGELKIDLVDGEYITDIWMWNNSTNTFKNVIIELSITERKNDKYIPHQEQSVSFPLKEGQVFHKEDYLADDGVHHVRKTRELDGTEAFIKQNQVQNNIFYIATRIEFKETHSELFCNKFKHVRFADKEVGIDNHYKNYIYFGIDISTIGATTETSEDEKVNLFKAKLAEWKANGEPLKIEYELEKEIIEPYSPEQQEAWNKIKKLKSYNNVTHIFSEDEVSPIYTAKTLLDIGAMIQENKNAILSLGGEV